MTRWLKRKLVWPIAKTCWSWEERLRDWGDRLEDFVWAAAPSKEQKRAEAVSLLETVERAKVAFIRPAWFEDEMFPRITTTVMNSEWPWPAVPEAAR